MILGEDSWERRQWMPTVLLGCLLAAVLGRSLERAWLQPITHDEALTWLKWARGPWAGFYENYIANNHLLNTAIAKLSVSWFGLSPLSLRAGGLLGAGLYLLGLPVLLRRMDGAWWRLLAAGLLTLNPLVMDYFALARGYSLAMAGLLWTLIAAMNYLSKDPRPRRWALGLGFWAAFTLLANLSFAFPLAALGGLVVAWDFLEPGSLGKRCSRVLFACRWAALPALVLASPLVGLWKGGAQRGSFTFGSPNLSSMTENLVRLSLFHGTDVRRHHGFLEPLSRVIENGGHALGMSLMGGLILGVFIAWRQGRRRRERGAAHAAQLLGLTGLVALGTVILLIAAHRWQGLPYPKSRTGLPLVLLVTLVAVFTTRLLSRRLRGPAGLALVALLALFALRASEGHFADWAYDRDSLARFRFFARWHDEEPDKPLSVLCVPFLHAPALEFYADMYDADWLRVERLRPANAASQLMGPFDAMSCHLPRRLAEDLSRQTKRPILLDDPTTSTIILGRVCKKNPPLEERGQINHREESQGH